MFAKKYYENFRSNGRFKFLLKTENSFKILQITLCRNRQVRESTMLDVKSMMEQMIDHNKLLIKSLVNSGMNELIIELKPEK